VGNLEQGLLFEGMKKEKERPNSIQERKEKIIIK